MSELIATPSEERLLLVAHPSMRRAPLLLILFVLLIAAFGLGLLLLLGWWIKNQCDSLTITDKRVIRRHGLVAKRESEVLNRDIRNIQIRQSVLQRIFHVGYIGISSAAQDDIEIEFDGISNPELVKELIDKHREM